MPPSTKPFHKANMKGNTRKSHLVPNTSSSTINPTTLKKSNLGTKTTTIDVLDAKTVKTSYLDTTSKFKLGTDTIMKTNLDTKTIKKTNLGTGTNTIKKFKLGANTIKIPNLSIKPTNKADLHANTIMKSNLNTKTTTKSGLGTKTNLATRTTTSADTLKKFTVGTDTIKKKNVNLFKKVNLDGGIFKKANLRGDIFKKVNLDGRIFKKANPGDGDFKKAGPGGGNFKKAGPGGGIMKKGNLGNNVIKKDTQGTSQKLVKLLSELISPQKKSDASDVKPSKYITTSRYGHGHVHKYNPTRSNKIFRCSGCKEVGFGERLRCNLCDNELHKRCMLPEDEIRIKWLGRETFKLHKKPLSKRVCDACAKDINGYFYHRDDYVNCCGGTRIRFDLHPCCSDLKPKLYAGSDIYTLTKEALPSSKCYLCHNKKLKGVSSSVPGWTYACASKDYCFHLSCVQEAIQEACVNKYFVEIDISLDDVAKSKVVDGSKSKSLKVFKEILEMIVSALLGDPFLDLGHVFGDKFVK